MLSENVGTVSYLVQATGGRICGVQRIPCLNSPRLGAASLRRRCFSVENVCDNERIGSRCRHQW